MEPMPEAPLLDTEANTPRQEGGEQQVLQPAEATEIQGASRRSVRCHGKLSRTVVLMSSSIVGMFVMAAIGATVLRAVMQPGLGSSTAELAFAEHVIESPMALTTFFFVIMLICASLMFCIWHLAHWQEARDVVAEQQAEEERRKQNLLKHLRGTEAFEMPPPDKPVPRRAGTSTSASQDEERRSICAICLEPLNTGDPCRLLPCNHIFHTTCTDTWLEDRHSCPTCRQDIRAPEDIPAEVQERRACLPVRVVFVIICILALTGVQDRIMAAIAPQAMKPQQNHAKNDVWAPAESSHPNVTAVHHYAIYAHRGHESIYDFGALATSPQDPTPAQGIQSGGFLRG